MEKCKLIIYFFRISSTCRRSLLGRILGFPVRLSYLLIVRWLLGVDIPDSVVIGDGLKIYHGYGLVVHGNAVLGENITLRHSTTIGNNGKTQACPQIAGECARHPTQLYEAGLEGFLLFLLLFYLAKSGRLKLPGLISGLFFFGYGLSRFVVEYFRVPDAQFFSEVNPNGYATEILGVGLTMGQLLSMPMILIGIGLVYRSFLVFR